MSRGLRRVLCTFGNGDCGRLGHSLADHASEELPRLVAALRSTPLKAVACGGAHTAALDEQGTVYSWGLNDKGQLGHDRDVNEVGLPAEVPVPERVVALAAGHFHTLCVGESGSVWSFGCNGYGQLGLGPDAVLVREPRLVKALQGDLRGVWWGGWRARCSSRTGVLTKRLTVLLRPHRLQTPRWWRLQPGSSTRWRSQRVGRCSAGATQPTAGWAMAASSGACSAAASSLCHA